ncbi:hypothetical protein BH23PLA1_BH23PLA1_14690 [soil metagenome]
MRMTQGWAGPRVALVALALAVAPTMASGDTIESEVEIGTTAMAEPMVTYSTVGGITVSENMITGSNVVGFNSIINQSFKAPSFVSLGEFQLISGLAAGTTSTYNDAPFTITIGFDKINGAVPDINQTPISIRGLLNGSITGDDQSNLAATWLIPEEPITFQVGDFVHSITDLNPVNIAPFTTNNGRTTIQARITSAEMEMQVPEPASLAVFLVAVAGGIGLHRRRALARARG